MCTCEHNLNQVQGSIQIEKTKGHKVNLLLSTELPNLYVNVIQIHSCVVQYTRNRNTE
jgi:hypothetical protein